MSPYYIGVFATAEERELALGVARHWYESPDYVPDLLRAWLRSGRPETFNSVPMTAIGAHGRSLIPEIKEALRDGDARGYLAASAAGEVADRELVGPLIAWAERATSAGDGQAQEHIVGPLGLIGGDEAVDYLKSAWETWELNTRSSLMVALARNATSDLEGIFIEGIHTPSDPLCRAAGDRAAADIRTTATLGLLEVGWPEAPTRVRAVLAGDHGPMDRGRLLANLRQLGVARLDLGELWGFYLAVPREGYTLAAWALVDALYRESACRPSPALLAQESLEVTPEVQSLMPAWRASDHRGRVQGATVLARVGVEEALPVALEEAQANEFGLGRLATDALLRSPFALRDEVLSLLPPPPEEENLASARLPALVVQARCNDDRARELCHRFHTAAACARQSALMYPLDGGPFPERKRHLGEYDLDAAECLALLDPREEQDLHLLWVFLETGESRVCASLPVRPSPRGAGLARESREARGSDLGGLQWPGP